MTFKEALDIVGGVSKTSKMPCYSYGLPASACKTGAKMALVKGSICSKCYARKGFYQFPSAKAAVERRLKSLDNPLWQEAMEIVLVNVTKKSKFFRWHDSGDLQSVEHFNMIVELAIALPEVKFWLPTQEWNTIIAKSAYADAIPKNLVIRRSAMFFDKFPDQDSEGLHAAVASNSGVELAKAKKMWLCPAPSQGGMCGTCRKCWDKKVKTVVYHKH